VRFYFWNGKPRKSVLDDDDDDQQKMDILGDEFLSSGGGGDDIDFDRAASAFPDISLDGTSDVPTSTHPALMSKNSSSGFDYDDFSTPPTDVKVTGDDELDLFESQFPDIGVPVVSQSQKPIQDPF
jgi:hypothetical protein